MPRLGGAVHEVPLAQRPLLALDDQQRLAGEDEEVLLSRFPVVHPDRLTRTKHEEINPDLREVRVSLEQQTLAPTLPVTPARLPGVQDEPPVSDRDKPALGLLDRGLGCHAEARRSFARTISSERTSATRLTSPSRVTR